MIVFGDYLYSTALLMSSANSKIEDLQGEKITDQKEVKFESRRRI